MPVFVPFIPPVQPQPTGPPAWVKLEPGEVFVRSFGAAAGAGGGKQRTIIMIALLTGLMVAAQIGYLVFRMAGRSAPVTDGSGRIPLIAAIAIATLLIVIGLAIFKSIRLRGMLQAVLTNRMLVFKVGKNISGFNLDQVVKLEPTGSQQAGSIYVYIKNQSEPAVKLPVPDIESALAELNAYAIAAGAKL